MWLRCAHAHAVAAALAAALVSARGHDGGGLDGARLLRCLGDAGCSRRLTGELAANTSTSASNRSWDLQVNPVVLEFKEADSVVNLGSAADQAGKITLAFYGDMRGLANGADPTTGGVRYGNVGVVVALKVALLAFTNGLVLNPPARRANVSYQVLWADTCKDIESNTSEGSRCLAPYALKLMHPLVMGRSASAAPAYSYVPAARALIGGRKWTTFIASMAGAEGVPNIGHWTSDRALSDKLVYPSFVRTDPTELLIFSAQIAVLQHFNFTVVDALACDSAQNRASATNFMDLALSSGITPAQFLISPETYSAWPAGGIYDDPDGRHQPEKSAQKKLQWDTVIAGMRAFNAHAHKFMLHTECPMYDVVSYLALAGLFKGGHVWIGEYPQLTTYETAYMDALTYYYPQVYNVTSPYASVTPFDNYMYTQGVQSGAAEADFLDLLKYVGLNQDRFLDPELSALIAKTRSQDGSYTWYTSPIEYLFDAVFTVLYAINALVLEVGEGFSNQQLLERIKRTDFQGVTGRVQFDSYGDRIQEQMVLQYRLPPGTTQMRRGITGTSVQVATYSQSLTITAPILFRAEEGRTKTTPPPDKDLDCEVGWWYDRDSGVCRICLAGTFTSRRGVAQCEPCVPGSYAAGNTSSSCLPCPEGFAAATVGSTTCTACAAGSYNDALQQSECRQCERGTYAHQGASVCTLCPEGSYAEARGHVDCVKCPGIMTTRTRGATTDSDCICPAGSYRDEYERSVCHSCPDGMVCLIGSDAVFISMFLDGNCTGADDHCVIPKTPPKYMTRKQEPLRSFLCLDDVACPGGPPGTCGARRDSDMVACGRCERGSHKDKKACAECQKGVNVVGVVIALAVCIVGLVVVVYAGNRDLILQSNSTMSIMVVSGITLSSIQTMGVFRNLAVEWFEPLSTIFSAIALIGFNLEILNLECVFKPNAATMYLFRQLAGPFALFFLLITVLIRKRHRPEMDALVVYANSAGTVFAALFISIASSCVLPLICYKHPGHNGESLLGDPTILCWESRDHTSTIVIGGLTFIVVLVPFMAIVAYATVRHHEFVALSVRGKGRALSAFRFLFFRFRPEPYFYGSILMLKGLLICLVPVVIRYDVAFQVCAMSTLLLLAQAVQLQLQPWRSVLANVVDGAGTAGLILFLVCGSAGSELSANKNSIKVLGSVIFGALCFSLLIGMVICLVRFLRPTPYFQWFVCHHKKDAGAQARLLKIIMELNAQTTFIDSDDLKDLDQLFDTVKCAVGHLLVYLTRDVLTRPWCAGEIATTAKKGTPMTGIYTPSWVAPREEEIEPDALPDYLDLSSTTLHQYSISFEHISAAYRHLLSDTVRKIRAGQDLVGQARFHSIVGQILGKPSSADLPVEPRPGMLVVSSDPGDDEATASAGILVSTVQAALFSFMPEGALLLVDGAAPNDDRVREAVWTARAVTVVLSRHSLESMDQLKVIAYSMARLRAKRETGEARMPPFEVIPLTTPSFEFPPQEYYGSTLPRLWPDDEDFSVEDMRVCLHSFFKRLAVSFSTHASNTVIESQAELVVDRVPKKWAPGGNFDSSEFQSQSIKALRGMSARQPVADNDPQDQGVDADGIGHQASEGSRGGSIPGQQWRVSSSQELLGYEFDLVASRV